ncbi:MAG: zinc-binding dehydrogenase [Sneathiella sp.]|uniref:zinc-binding dehydrogenase n=1 Tax=Sneathiella sp. TaxID=1964365 RepID=UPI0030038E01
MVTVQRSTVINAPINEVWELLRDFNGHDSWHPAVATSVLDNGKRTDQIGAIRNFQLTSGENLREQLLSMSDKEHSFRYAIVESDIPLRNYVAEVSLRPVTDGNATYWNWFSRFETPQGQEDELAELVANGVYEGGFEAIRSRVGESTSGQSAAPIDQSPLEGTAVMLDRYGGPEEFYLSPVVCVAPAAGEVRICQTAIGVNFIDVYCRSGYFDLLELPGIPGMEAVGIVESVGDGVRHLAQGQRVGYACPPVGAYTTVRTMKADLVFSLPDFLDDEVAAAGLLKGISAEFLLHRVHALKRGEIVLVYAPAGGVGKIICQWANHLGATVIGATSSEEKARIARASGAHHVILPGSESLEDQVLRLTKGHGADVIYDAVGKDSFSHSVAALADCGHLISFGQASGDIGSYDIGSLSSRSATVSRPNFGHYTDTPEKLRAITERLFGVLEKRIISIEIGQKYPLSNAPEAHRQLEGRMTTGSTILIPDELLKGRK